MNVTLADSAITVQGWLPALDRIGAYTQKVPKTAEDREADKAAGKTYSGAKNFKLERKSVITKDEKDPGTVYFLPGLWPRVKSELDSRGIEYTVADNRNPAIRPVPDYAALAGTEFRFGQMEALAKIVACDCGILAASVGFGKSWLIAKLCRIYPTLNIVVTTDMVTVVKQLYKDINAELPGQVGMLSGTTDTTSGKRIIVSTLNSLVKINPAKVHLLLVDEAHCVGSEKRSELLARMSFCRRFGFTATPVRNDGTELVMESVVGPVIMKTTYSDGVAHGMVTPVSYAMIPCGRAPSIVMSRGFVPDWLMQRFGYYRNSYRNWCIKNIVESIRAVYSGQILIVCSTTEHMIMLHQLLPYFLTAHAENFDPAEMSRKLFKTLPGVDFSKYKSTAKQNDIRLAAFAKGTIKYLISTKIVKQGLNMKHLRCLIRADGTKSEIDCFQIPGRLSRLDENKDMAYLIDFDDTFSFPAANKSKERRALYDSYGWKMITAEEVVNGLARADSEGGCGLPGRGAEEQAPGTGADGAGEQDAGRV